MLTNVIGKVYGPFTIVSKVPNIKGTHYNVVCEICGNKKIYSISELNRTKDGLYRSCGCLKKTGLYNNDNFFVAKKIDDRFLLTCKKCHIQFIDTVENVRKGTVILCNCLEKKESESISKPKILLEGKIFGKLTVISESNTTKRMWNTVCECGEERLVKQRDLLSGESTRCISCAKEDSRKYLTKPTDSIGGFIMNKTFGKLKVLESDQSKSKYNGKLKKQDYYICLCSCGERISLSKFRLLNGKTTSCPKCKPQTQTQRRKVLSEIK